MRSELVHRLRALYRRPADGQLEHRRAGEDERVAAFERRQAGGSPRPRARRRLPRIVVASGLGVAAAVGACALPSEYPVNFGQGIEIVLEAERWGELSPEILAEELGEALGAERIELHVARSRDERVGPQGEPIVEEQVRMQLFVLGGHVDSDDDWEAIVERFPVLAEAEIEQVPLSGMVHGTLGGRLSRDLLDLTIDRHGVQEAERQILAELRAEGIAPENATVDVEAYEQDGKRRIEVRVEAHDDAEAP